MTSTRSGKRAGILAAWAGALLLAASAAAAQEDTDARWLPWVGCWEGVEQQSAGVVTTGGPDEVQGALLCVSPAGGPWVEMLTVVDGEITARELVSADGSQQETTREGCSGWDQAEFSADATRIYVRSEHACEGGIQRTASGLIAFVSPVEWIETQGVRITGTGRSMAWIRRYRLASPERAEAAGLGDLGAGLAMAVESGRIAAASRLDVDDVIDATAAVDGEAVKAWISEQNDPFDLDAARLVRLADSEVPEGVIDVVVAVSYPDRFVVGDDAVRTAEGDGAVGYPRGPRRSFGYGGGFYSPFGYRSLYSSSFGYGYSPYGYGSGYGYGAYGGFYPRVVVVEPRAPAARARAVNGRGYTRGGARPSGGSRSSGLSPSRRGDGGNGASAGSSGSGSTRRTAKRRGGGDGGS